MSAADKRKMNYYNFAIQGIFIFYLAVMTWIILFKFAPPERLYSIRTSRVLNLIPFNDLIVGKPMSAFETIGNILIFIPFGIFISMIASDASVKNKIIMGMMLSIGYETVQFILSIGVADSTDVLTNTAGCAVGIGAYTLMRNLIRNELKIKRMVVLCSAAACVPSVAVLPMMSALRK